MTIGRLTVRRMQQRLKLTATQLRRRSLRILFNRSDWAPTRRRIIVLGDSHAGVFERYVAPRVNALFDIVSVLGATAGGMANPNSRTAALPVFQARLARAPGAQTVLLELGDVDCDYVIWYRAEKHGLTVDEQFETSLANYLAFIDSLITRGLAVWVMSAPLPTIGDGPQRGEVARLRQGVSVRQIDRTSLTIRFNRRLQLWCLERGIRFIDVSGEQLDASTGIIKPNFLNRDPLDNHLDDASWGNTIVRELVSTDHRWDVTSQAFTPPILNRSPRGRRRWAGR